jgi:hypothetical protein
MNSYTRLLLFSCLVGLMLTWIGINPPEWLGDLACDLETLRESGTSLETSWQKRAEEKSILRQREKNLAIKSRLVDALVAHGLTLLEAVAQFRKSTNFPSEFWANLRTFYTGRSDDERLARHLILCVELDLGQRPTEALRVVRYLETELAEH